MLKNILPISVLLSLALPATASAKDFVLCQAPNWGDVVIQLEYEVFNDRLLTCLAADWAQGMKPCSPENAYALSGGTYGDTLLSVTEDRDKLASKDGNVFTFGSDEANYYFAAWKQTAGEEMPNFQFTVNRITGKADLQYLLGYTDDGELEFDHAAFECSPYEAKF